MPRRANHNLPAVQEKRAEVVRLRGKGLTWDEIARQAGYSNGSGAAKAWKAAIQQRPDLTVDEVRAQEKTRLEEMDATLAGIVSNPPVKSTAIGRVMWDPRTCTCGVRGDTKREHAEDCDVVPVLDTGQVTAAVRARLAVGESYRKLVGADQQSPGVIDARTQIVLAEINQYRTGKGQQPLRQPEPAPVTMSEADAAAAAAASLAAMQPWAARRRAEVIAEVYTAKGQPVPAHIRAQLDDHQADNDIVDAEVIED